MQGVHGHRRRRERRISHRGPEQGIWIDAAHLGAGAASGRHRRRAHGPDSASGPSRARRGISRRVATFSQATTRPPVDAMQAIATWLKTLGLAQYAHCFAENDIDFWMLRDLTDSDLEKIGIQSLGHRRKLMLAIIDLRAIDMSPAAGAPSVDAPGASRSLDAAERRQVTVMFVDLVGSTALSARMDPEDLREVISAYRNRVTETVHRFDGFVAQYIGDSVLVYFGYPLAHEDDAEQAVRVGLELVEAVTALES